MISIFTISLPDSTQRREALTRRMEALSLPFEFFDAVDGRQGIPAEFEGMVDRENSLVRFERPMVDTEFACALSHVMVYRTIVERGIPFALVLEDDAIPDPDLPQYLAGEYFRGADLVSLAYRRTHVVKRSAENLFGPYRAYRPFRWLRNPESTAGYVVSRDAARYMAENTIPIVREADWPNCANRFRRNRTWKVVYPRLIKTSYSNDPADGFMSIIDEHGRAHADAGRSRISRGGAKRMFQKVLAEICTPLLGLKKIRTKD